MRIQDMFRFFDRNFTNKISFTELRVVCDELLMGFTSKEMKMLFNYLDKNGSGNINYREFQVVSDDYRMGLDPSKNQQALDNFDNDRLIKNNNNRSEKE